MNRFILPLLVLAALSACGGDSMSATAPVAPAPAPMPANFTAFMLALLRNQSDTASPAPVSASQFVFPDDDNPAAFAAVLGGP